jgi:DNA invertase Pin-like site-specific DNA recombinase
MERPAVQQMLDLVRSGDVNLIIIKDFSRFSRNAMDSGYFIEQVFPLYGVRLISVSDNFDSDDYKGNTGGIEVAFKLLMHEYYSQDLSKKVKSAKRLQMKRGENIVAKAIYGYSKINGKWEPDGIASEIVRRIYDYALNNLSPAQIRDKLFAEQIPTPQEYLELGHGKKITPNYLWEARAVTRILTNEQYKGTYISGKQNSKAVGSHSKDWVEKSDWIVIPNSHTPIISSEIFDKVQEIMKSFLTSEITPKNIKHCQSELTPTERKTRTLPYGYRYGGNGNWQLDEKSSEVVKRVFSLALKGLHESETAEILKSAKIPAPAEYKKLRCGEELTPTCTWRTKGVRDILRDIQYTGAYVSGKFGVKSDGSNQHYRTHESDWLIIPDKFPAIISKSDFDKVAEIMANRGKRKLKSLDYLLRGNIVKCGCCGYAMNYDNISDPVYRCYHTAADPNAECHKLKISAKLLDKVVLTVIRKKAELVLNTAGLSKLRSKTFDETKIADCETQILQSTEELQKQYERFALGEISRNEYLKMKTERNSRLEQLKQHLSTTKAELAAGKVDPRVVEVANSARSESTNERELVETLIETVQVYPNMRVDINWKISDFAITG